MLAAIIESSDSSSDSNISPLADIETCDQTTGFEFCEDEEDYATLANSGIIWKFKCFL